MLLATGMRIGELFSLPLADYHGDYVVGGEKTEAGRNRTIPIRPEGKQHFAYFAGRAKGALLLSGYDGQKVPANFRRRDFYPLLDRLGIERKTPHATHMRQERSRKVLPRKCCKKNTRPRRLFHNGKHLHPHRRRNTGDRRY